MVNDIREVNLKQKGKQDLVYEGIASSVIFESIIPTFSKPTILYSQNYKYDILSLDKLLDKNINKIVKYRVYTSQFKYKTKSAILLSKNPIILKTKNEIISNVQQSDIVFDKIPSDLLTKPSLIWETSSKAGNQDIKLNYLTQGISWKSDYVLNLDDTNTLTAWISITNNSGTAYKNANIYCMAGDVKTSKPKPIRRMYKNIVTMEAASAPMVTQKEFAGYHLYKIPFKQSLNNNQKKQISFLNIPNIKINEYASIADNMYMHKFSNINFKKFNHNISFENKLSNNMGIPLPKGTIRVYKKDGDISHFIGQDNINHTPKNEKVYITIGKYFDLTQKITQLDFKKTKSSVMSKYKRAIKNNSNKIQIIKIQETNYSNNIKSFENINNCKENCSVKKMGLAHYEYTIKLKPNAKYSLTTQYSIKYERY
jgi:hypothetical protein